MYLICMEKTKYPLFFYTRKAYAFSHHIRNLSPEQGISYPRKGFLKRGGGELKVKKVRFLGGYGMAGMGEENPSETQVKTYFFQGN